MIGIFTEMEYDIVSETVKSGVVSDRAKGKIVGRAVLKLGDTLKKVIETCELYKCVAIFFMIFYKKYVKYRRHSKYILEIVIKRYHIIKLITNIIKRVKLFLFLHF